MKIQWLTILIFTLISCQSKQLKEETLHSIKHTDSLKKGNKLIDSFEVVKEYNLNFEINTIADTIQLFKSIEEIYFGFYQLDSVKYFYPKFLLISAHSSNCSFNNFRKLTIEKKTKNEIEFELELCLRINPIDNDKEGFITGLEVKKAIKKIIKDDSLNTISILSDNYSKNSKSENIICRKFHFKKIESKVIVGKGKFINRINPKDLIKYGELEIIETGNILDTINIEQKIWDRIGEDF